VTPSGDGITPDEQALVGTVVRGTVLAVFTWGVIVDIGLSRPALIDALYVDDGDAYIVGDEVNANLDHFDEGKQQFLLRPEGQERVADRLRRKGFDI
jgi:ribosomal protein S1